jgi:hypothetical protein
VQTQPKLKALQAAGVRALNDYNKTLAAGIEVTPKAAAILQNVAGRAERGPIG